MGEWKPAERLSDDEEARAELDRRVKAIRWTDRAIEFGSPERLKVAGWLNGTDLVYGEMRRLYPVEEQRQTMTRWVLGRVSEKITGIPIDSKSSQWNWNGLWDPNEPTSFCGWARRVSIPLAQWNAKRVLKSRTVAASVLEDEDGHNPAYDDADSRNALQQPGGGLDVFDRHPDLRVPRPVGKIREDLMRAATNGVAMDAIRLAREQGGWHPSLDGLDDGLVAALLLAPIPMSLAPMMERFDADPAMRDAIRLYWPTQTSKRRVYQPDLQRAVAKAAAMRGVREWEILLDLGTMAARLAVG